MLLDFHPDGFQVEAHLLQHIHGDPLAKFDQPEQKMLCPHVVMVETVGLFAGERQHLLGAWSKIIHHCVSAAGPSIWPPDNLFLFGLGKLFNFSLTMSARRWSRSSAASFCWERC